MVETPWFTCRSRTTVLYLLWAISSRSVKSGSLTEPATVGSGAGGSVRRRRSQRKRNTRGFRSPPSKTRTRKEEKGRFKGGGRKGGREGRGGNCSSFGFSLALMVPEGNLKVRESEISQMVLGSCRRGQKGTRGLVGMRLRLLPVRCTDTLRLFLFTAHPWERENVTICKSSGSNNPRACIWTKVGMGFDDDWGDWDGNKMVFRIKLSFFLVNLALKKRRKE